MIDDEVSGTSLNTIIWISGEVLLSLSILGIDKAAAIGSGASVNHRYYTLANGLPSAAEAFDSTPMREEKNDAQPESFGPVK